MPFSLDHSSIRRRPRVAPVVGSLAAHTVFFAWLFAGPLPKSPSAYRVMIKPRETKLVWYNFKSKLPEVSPSARQTDNRPLRAEAIDRQQIVSSPTDAPRAPQMIFHPVPQLRPVPVTPLPNMIALAAPPPPPVQKVFQAPRAVARQRATPQLNEIAKAPELEVKLSTPSVPSPTLPKLFTPPPENRPKPQARIELSNAPEISAANPEAPKTGASAIDQASRIWVFRPQTKTSKTSGTGALPDAPALENQSQSTANIAVVGLNPIQNLTAPLPQGSRSARFSAGPKLNPNGASSSGNSSGITVPDLTVRGGEKAAPSNIIAQVMSPQYTTPNSHEFLRGVGRPVESTLARNQPQPDPPAGTRVSGAPDPRFIGRTVFSVAIQSPNLTSHMGSWLMWYADRSLLTNRAPISAPEPVHEVDPKYIATAVEERVEGTVRLAFVIGDDGRVHGVETVKGVDPRLDRSAADALEKWLFTPATRDGRSIEVDAVVEIPFRLSPVPRK